VTGAATDATAEAQDIEPVAATPSADLEQVAEALQSAVEDVTAMAAAADEVADVAPIAQKPPADLEPVAETLHSPLEEVTAAPADGMDQVAVESAAETLQDAVASGGAGMQELAASEPAVEALQPSLADVTPTAVTGVDDIAEVDRTAETLQAPAEDLTAASAEMADLTSAEPLAEALDAPAEKLEMTAVAEIASFEPLQPTVQELTAPLAAAGDELTAASAATFENATPPSTLASGTDEIVFMSASGLSGSDPPVSAARAVRDVQLSSDLLQPPAADVASVVEQRTNAVAEVLSPVVEPAASVAATVQAVEPPAAGAAAVAERVADAVTARSEPVQSQVEQVAATAGASVDRLAAVTAHAPVEKTVQSLGDGVATGAGATADEVAAVANRTLDGGGGAVSNAVSGRTESPLSDVLTAVDGTASVPGAGARDGGAPQDFLQGLLADVGTLIPETAEAGPTTIPSLLGPAPITDVTEPAVATVDEAAGAATGEAVPVAPESLAETVQSLPEDLAAGPGVLADLLTTVADVGADSVAGAAEAVAAEEFLLVSGGIAAVAAVAAYAGRGAAALNAPLLFTSLRLIPCYAAEMGQQYVTHAVARTAAVVDRLDAIRPTRDTLAEARSRLPSADGFVRSFRDGLSRGANGGSLADDAGEGASDSRLMMQIGMLLGIAYLGFLTVWFWATRLRPHPGS
jgi:hypothetical protein